MRDLKRTGEEPGNPYRVAAAQRQTRRGGKGLQTRLQEHMTKLADDHDANQPAEPEPNQSSDPTNWFDIPRHAAYHLAHAIDHGHPAHIVDARRAMFTRAIGGGYGPEALSEYLAASKGLQWPTPADEAQNGGQEG